MSKNSTVYARSQDLLTAVEVTVDIDYPDVRIALKGSGGKRIVGMLQPTAAQVISDQLEAAALQVEAARNKAMDKDPV